MWIIIAAISEAGASNTILSSKRFDLAVHRSDPRPSHPGTGGHGNRRAETARRNAAEKGDKCRLSPEQIKTGAAK